MNFIPFRDEHAGRWDDFCRAQSRAWFWHTSWRMRHALDCSFKIRGENRSFWVEDGGQMRAIVPLTVDDHQEGGAAVRKLSYGGGFVPAPVIDASLSSLAAGRLSKRIFAEIDRIAAESGAKVLQMRLALPPALAAETPQHNALLRHGFLDVSLGTQIVSLAPSEPELFDGLGKNHQQSIRKAQPHLEIVLHDQASITSEAFSAFQSFYFKAAGKVTRPESTFRLLHGYLRDGMAVMGEARHGGKAVGYSVAVHFKGSAYYLMGAADDSFTLAPTAHILLWEVMRALKARGVSHFELGAQQFGPLLHDFPSPKEVNISLFKRGFGGSTCAAFTGERYYCADYFRKVADERAARYEAALRQPASMEK